MSWQRLVAVFIKEFQQMLRDRLTFAMAIGVPIAAGVLYFNFAWFREQFCVVLCPYGRLQSVLQDRDKAAAAAKSLGIQIDPNGLAVENDNRIQIDPNG